MPDNKCDTCVECFQKHNNPSTKKTTCINYVEDFDKMMKLYKRTQVQTYTFESTKK
jgi:hypothetical protein